MDDKVSIIMPSYNASRFIAESIKSVLIQTYTNWELIVVDDCSNDNTVQIVEDYIKHDNRIKLIKLKSNKGAANARNVALKNANGKYIAFLDSDDLWKKQKLEKQVKFMKENNISFSFTNYRMIDERGELTNKIVNCPPQVNYNLLLKNTTIGCLTVMLDKTKIGDFHFPNIKPEDTALWLSILRRGETAYCLREELALYRLVEGSVSSNRLKAAKNYWHMIRSFEKLNLFNSLYCFVNYSLNAIQKHYFNSGIRKLN